MKIFKRLVIFAMSIVLALPLFACDNALGNSGVLRVLSDKNPTIKIDETYTLILEYPSAFVFTVEPTAETAHLAEIEPNAARTHFVVTPLETGVFVIEVKGATVVLETVSVTIEPSDDGGGDDGELVITSEKNPTIKVGENYMLTVDYPDTFDFSASIKSETASFASITQIGSSKKQYRIRGLAAGTAVVEMFNGDVLLESMNVVVQAVEITTLTLLSQNNSVVSHEATYTLRVDFPQGYNFSAEIDDSTKAVADINVVDQTENKEWLVTPKSIGQCVINLLNGSNVEMKVNVFFAENGVWDLVVLSSKNATITNVDTYLLRVNYPSAYQFSAAISDETKKVGQLSDTENPKEFLFTPKWIGVCNINLYNDGVLADTVKVTVNLPTVAAYVSLTDANAQIDENETFPILINYPATMVNVVVALSDDTKNIAVLSKVGQTNKEFLLTPTTVGIAKVEVRNNGQLVGTIVVNIMGRYPANPLFNIMTNSPGSVTNWTENTTHDPSMIEVDGVYYTFSTDINGQAPGYQIRRSDNLLHWKYVGTAISQADLNSGMFDEIKAWNTSVTSWGFWAPDIVKGADGKFWLYFCHTNAFGSSRSILGLAKSTSITGPYKLDSYIVKSGFNGISSTPNAIDPQIIYEENDPQKQMYMAYGSFFGGIHMIKLDNNTGRRMVAVDDPTSATDDRNSSTSYFGKRIATGSMEGPVITYQPNVRVLNEVSGEYETKAYYYLFTSYYDLTSTYHMRSARSENIEGPYVDVNGNTMKTSGGNTGNKVMGSFKWANDEFDYSAPGHNDLFTTSKGVNLVVYHCRTWRFSSTNNNYHFLYLSQFAFNSRGDLVMNPNRYAVERLRKIDKEEITSPSISNGAYMMVTFNNASEDRVDSIDIQLDPNGDITGAKTGTWELYDDYFIKLVINGEVFEGVVMPAWLKGPSKAGLTVTAMSTTTGMALYLNPKF